MAEIMRMRKILMLITSVRVKIQQEMGKLWRGTESAPPPGSEKPQKARY